MRFARVETEDGEIVSVWSQDGAAWRRTLDDAFGIDPVGRLIVPKKFHAPVQPPAIFGIGQNYRRHAQEMGSPIPEWPVVFMKNPASVIGPDDPIVRPRILESAKVDYEAELAIVMGMWCKNAKFESAMDFVAGFTCANDVSARDWQKEWGGGQFCKGKGFDTFCPIGPWIVSPDELGDPQSLAIASRVNGETRQSWTTGDMIFSICDLIAFLSADTSLAPGTLILTGTPHGVGAAHNPPKFLNEGDLVEIEIQGIGILSNPVR
jgi:2-keto-4-pentenoate hydratase/2-oxohepta-3-ene-1,7-dioic acid hydratase in catechol pathway